MKLRFSLHFRTEYGQIPFVCGSVPELGGNDPDHALPMTFHPDFTWTLECDIERKPEEVLSYRYFIRNSDGSCMPEAGAPRRITLAPCFRLADFHDQWQGHSEEAPFLTAPFASIFYPQPVPSHKHTAHPPCEIRIRATVPLVGRDEEILICGEPACLGNWDTERARPMQPCGGSRWEICLPAEECPHSFRYKFLLRRPGAGTCWENGEDRTLVRPELPQGTLFTVEHAATGLPLGKPRFAGTAIPVFSLRSESGFGIGDFTDLKKMADWAVLTGQQVLQLLPVNDTTSTGTWTDSYPYSAISVMALHPIYLNPDAVGPLGNSRAAAGLARRRRLLNALPEIDYEAVLALKNEYIRLLFRQYAADTFADPGFQAFYRDNKSWLLPYAAFCTLREKYGTADFSRWESDAVYTPGIAERLNASGTSTRESLSVHFFVQYHLHRQLKDAVSYAHSKGIVLKGDIPIGITPHSVEAWTEPGYFHMDAQAGAPPDDFAVNGQNWGFPTYDWEAMARDRFGWWKRRFSRMAEYFDLYRIDHVLGFFRIWEIPRCETRGLMGHFSPALPFSADEIRSYGFDFRPGEHDRPCIRYPMLQERFGDTCERVMQEFLDSPAYEVFTLKPEFSTQRAIEEHFRNAQTPEDRNLMEGLVSLVSERLFLEDPHIPGRYHPRISAQNTYAYRCLDAGQQASYNRLYDDFFYRRHNDFWDRQARRKLPELIAATGMMACAEDLGMIPDCVPRVLRDLQIATLEIQRMPKDPALAFAVPARYPYLSVCTTGTHDTSTLREWWEEDRGKTEAYYRNILGEQDEAPRFCEPWICERIVRDHLESPAMLVILPWQDWMATDGRLRLENPARERINVPSNPRHYWRYRMHLALEYLLEQEEFNGKLKQTVTNCILHKNR